MRERKLPTASSLERVEPPSPTLADAQREALVREVADKPGFQEALADLNRLEPASPPQLTPFASKATLKTKPVEAERVTAKVLRPVVPPSPSLDDAPAAPSARKVPLWLGLAAALALAASLVALILASSDHSKNQGTSGSGLPPTAVPTATPPAATTYALPSSATPAPIRSDTPSVLPSSTGGANTTATSARPSPSAKPAGSGSGKLNGNWGWK